MRTRNISVKPAMLAAAIAGLLVVLLSGAVSSGTTVEGSQATTDVAISDFFFSQSVITVPTGATVQWTNIGGFSHTTTSNDALWDSGVLGAQNFFTHTMTIPGHFGYFCSIHPGMQGTVVVTGTFPNSLYLPALWRK